MAKCIIISGGTWSPDNWCKTKRSLGPYRLATVLEQAGYSTFVLDFVESFSKEEIVKALDKHVDEETLWVGFSSTFFWSNNKIYNSIQQDAKNSMYYTSNYADVKYVLNYIKFKSKAKILYGGAKSPFFALNDVDENVDYYVNDNADVSIINITDYISGKVDKIEHLDGRVIDSTKYDEPDVSNIPTDWTKQPILQGEGLPLELARGCIFKCKFCAYPLLGKKKGTYLRGVEQVRDDIIKTWEAHGTESFFITDDTFNDDNDKLDALHSMFTSLPFKPKLSSYLRIDLIHKYPHQAEQLADMGLIGTFFGLETLQKESAKSIGKGLNPEKVKERLYWLKEQWVGKVNMEAGFILGLPYDTEAYFQELINWCLENDNPLDAVHFYPLIMFNYKEKQLHRYTSEFAINPEVYGYKMDNTCYWSLPQQKLNFDICSDYSNKFNTLRKSMNKVSGFYTTTCLNTGVSLEDIYNLTQNEIEAKYNIPEMNKQKMNEYKRMIGL